MKAQINTANIRKILARKQMSQNWLAFRTRTTSGYMSQMITGKRNPSSKMRDKILQVLGDCNSEDIFTS